MEQIMNYVKPELIIVAVVLYFLGMWFKQAAFIKDKYIPLALGLIGVIICGIWVLSTSVFENTQSVFAGIFAAITQGILVSYLVLE